MTHVVDEDTADVWSRSAWKVPGAIATLLAVATGVALADSITGTRRIMVVALAMTFGCWQIAWRPWRRDLAQPSASMRGVVWGTGTIVIWIGLLLLHPAFHLVLFAIFPLLFVSLTIRLASVSAVVLSMAVGAILVRGSTDVVTAAGVVLFAAIGGVLSIVLGRWIHGIIVQSRERADLIAELRAAHDDLARAERAAGVLTERARLAAEIHDTLAQGFTSIVLLLETVRTRILDEQPDAEVPPEVVLGRLGLAIDTARENLAEARHLVDDLAPPTLAATSLPDALRRAGTGLGAATGASVDVAIAGEPRRLRTEQEVAILRVAQESLSNVRRHASACSVAVTLSYEDPDGTRLVVVDDGCGFDLGRTPGGFGLRGMVDRVSPLGGDVRVESVVGRGTKVAAWLP